VNEIVTCHCTKGKAAPNGGDRCDCTEARVHAAELQAVFDLQWRADQRAIKRWRAAHPDKENVWPDRADMVVWLMDQLEA
jgi:hypothetical protein